MTMEKDYIENIEGAERRFYTSPVEIRKEGEKEFFRGTAVPFDQVTDLGYFTEEISREAIEPVLNDDVRGLFNHDANYVLGRNKSGTMQLRLDEKALNYEILYNPNDPDHVRVMEKVKRGDVSQSSYAFSVKDEKWSKRDGKQHRTITRLSQLIDVSPVTYPANPNTSVAKRSLETMTKGETEKLQKENERAAKQRQIAVEIDRIKLGIF